MQRLIAHVFGYNLVSKVSPLDRDFEHLIECYTNAPKKDLPRLIRQAQRLGKVLFKRTDRFAIEITCETVEHSVVYRQLGGKKESKRE